MVVLAIFATGCRSVPITGRSQLMLTGESYENQLGKEAYNEYLKQYPRSTNTVYTSALNRVGRAIQEVSGQDDFEWEFNVLQSKTENAFCLPGGKVAVYSGLIDVMNNEAELACVVAHEVGHAIARHSGERLSWSELRALGALGVAIGLNDEPANQIYGVGTELGVMLPFSRSNEYEADQIGLILMARAGYNPQAALDFWSRFSQGKSSSLLDTITSTHPCDVDRIKNFDEYLPQAKEEFRAAKVKRNYGVSFQRK